MRLPHNEGKLNAMVNGETESSLAYQMASRWYADVGCFYILTGMLIYMYNACLSPGIKGSRLFAINESR